MCLRNRITESLMMRDLGVLRMVADSLDFETMPCHHCKGRVKGRWELLVGDR
jgi:hypothetical protein